MGRDFSTGPVDQRWCGDLTEIPTDEGKLYSATVLDLGSRRLPGFALGEHHDSALAKAALCMAAAVRGGVVAGVVFHTDKGGEYVGDLFAGACTALGVIQSMGRVGLAVEMPPRRASTRPSSTSSCPGSTSPPRTRPGARSPGSSTPTTIAVATAPARCSRRSPTRRCSPNAPPRQPGAIRPRETGLSDRP